MESWRRYGYSECDDAVFFSAWGSLWRDWFDDISSLDVWRAERVHFVAAACSALNLPLPRAPEQTPDHTEDVDALPPRKRQMRWHVQDLILPSPLARDRLWTRGLSSLQLEFVVHNQALADIANGTAKITNDQNQEPLARIRLRLMDLFQDT